MSHRATSMPTESVAENMTLDRISALPDELLSQILALIPTKDVVGTMVLSKRWHSLWTMVPKLKFDSLKEGTLLGSFTELVNRSLLSNKFPVLESLCLRIDSGSVRSEDMRIWVRIAVERRVRELDICAYDYEYDYEDGEDGILLPSSLYTCETLERLILRDYILVDVPSRCCFRSLKTLHLMGVRFKDFECFHGLLSSCPVLEDLTVEWYSDVYEIYAIEMPSLQRLSARNMCGGYGGLVIDTPSLKYLHIVDYTGNDFVLVENMPEVVEAKVTVIPPLKLLGSLISVKRLSLAVQDVLLPSDDDMVFNQLVHLELRICGDDWGDLFAYMLEASPNLRVLKLKNERFFYMVPRISWKRPVDVPPCLFSSLETFQWKRYIGSEPEKEVAEYILTNATCLKMVSICLKGNLALEEKHRIQQDLASMPWGSSSCELIILDD